MPENAGGGVQESGSWMLVFANMTVMGRWSVMVWGGIHLHGRTPLHFVQGNLFGVRYRDEIVRRIVLPTVQAFMRDSPG